MSAAQTLGELADARVIAVLRVSEAGRTGPAISALLDGGVRAVEVTWTSAEPAGELAAARAEHGDELLLGAGTLRTPGDVDAALEAGADFLVSPHFRADLYERMRGSGKLALPGVLTPTEVAAAMDAGADAVKLFPCSLGGVGYMKALLGPFPDLKVVPTGGVNAGNVAEWLTAGALAVGAAGELCPPAAIADGRWDELRQAARAFMRAAGG
jgi:2-dehydro-3-deoxyphosphogluconate aldolase/(4S)-4-hydroxy-2-oxoglutarate aldolase